MAEDAEGVDTAREWAGTTHAECLMRMARSGRFRAKSSGDIYIRSQCPDEDDGRKCNSTAPRATRQPLSTFDFRLRSVRPQRHGRIRGIHGPCSLPAVRKDAGDDVHG